jgi:hypothetical protein
MRARSTVVGPLVAAARIRGWRIIASQATEIAVQVPVMSEPGGDRSTVGCVDLVPGGVRPGPAWIADDTDQGSRPGESTTCAPHGAARRPRYFPSTGMVATDRSAEFEKFEAIFWASGPPPEFTRAAPSIPGPDRRG